MVPAPIYGALRDHYQEMLVRENLHKRYVWNDDFLQTNNYPGTYDSFMVIRVVEFSSGGYKIRKIFAEESTYPKRKLLNFENWGVGKNWASL